MIKTRMIDTGKDLGWLDGVILRKADQSELCTSYGIDNPQEALVRCIKDSTEGANIATAEDGAVLMIYGLSHLTEKIGIPWMVGTDAVMDHKLILLRQGVQIVEAMLCQYPMLFNTVDSRNSEHIAWLAWMGFLFLPEEIMVDGVPFLPFMKRRT